MNKHITLRRMKNAIKYFVDKSPNRVYRGINNSSYCMYYDAILEEPSCLIGKALHKLGVSVELLKQLDHATSTKTSCFIGNDDFNNVMSVAGWQLEDKAIDFARMVQARQDLQAQWKVAYNKACDAVN